ncbi:MAG: DNA polymerase Y family protein [Deltaproteobacteria bacterium]|nr:DNA polymerase Y family protein [Deltaproteobacteria bacterium]
MAVSRTLVLHLPAFRLERCGYDADQVAVLTAEQKSAVRLVALTPAARAAGLRENMTATEARARQPDVLLEAYAAAGEDFDRQALLQVLTQFSDRVFPLFEEDFALGVEGTARLFGGEASLLAQVRGLLEDLGHVSQGAVADDPLAATALAGWGPGDVVVPPGQAARALAPLPIAALRPSKDLALALATLGIERVGQWARLDPASVAGRFGEDGVVLHRVARGLFAQGPEPPGWREVEPITASVVLGGPTTNLEPIFFVLPGLLRQIAGGLLRRDEAAVLLAIHFVLEGGPARTLRVRVGRPTLNPDQMQRVVRARLHDLRLDAPVVELQIEVEGAVPRPTWQLGLVDRTEVREPLEDLLARLIDALGEEALLTPKRVEEWCPERAWRPLPLDPGRVRPRSLRRSSRPPRARSGQRIDPVDAIEAFERRVPRPRPTMLLPRPLPIEVRLCDGRPTSVHLEHGWERISRSEGPERLRGTWWSESQVFDRSYWVVQLLQRVGWIFEDYGRRRAASGCWYWHGWFD